MATLFEYPLFHADDGNGRPLRGGLLYTYVVDTTTNKETYSDSALTVPNANPVVLDTRGNATVYASGAYDFKLTDSTGALIWTFDGWAEASVTDLVVSGTLDVAGLSTLADVTVSDLTASKPVFTNGSKNLVSTGTVPVNQGGSGQTTYTNGQVLIGNTTGNTLAKSTLTAGTGITITNGTGTIEISTTQTDIAPFFPGLFSRTTFGWTDADTITLAPALYNHNGTTEQLVYWDGALSFDVGSGGTNADSSDLAATTPTYMYIDDSAVVTAASAVISATELVNSNTAPTWSDSKHGWYNANDRCIGGFWVNSVPALVEFYHDGSTLVMYDEQIATNIDDTDVDDVFVDCVFEVPNFGDNALAMAHTEAIYDTANAGTTYWRKNGSAATNGHEVNGSNAGVIFQDNTTIVTMDGSQTIEVRMAASTASTLTVNASGYFFPQGI